MNQKPLPLLGDLPVVDPQGSDTEMLELLQRETFGYFLGEFNSATGLIADRNEPGSPSSIAAVGLGITSYVAGVTRGLLSRQEAALKVLTVLKFFESSQQGPQPNTTGYRGFYYHFLDMVTGKRAGLCELSTIDTAILMAGILTATEYFQDAGADETEIRRVGNFLYERVDWQWALNGKDSLSHGWTPESGFIPYRWDQGYSEAIILYVLALGSPTFPIDPKGYRAWTETFEWKTLYDTTHFYAGPFLFTKCLISGSTSEESATK